MRKVILILLLMIAPNLFSQNQDEQEYEIVTHRVMMGETVRMLSKKYLIPPSVIYRMNKFAVDGISQGMVLQIPVPVKNKPVPEQEVAQQETPVTETPPSETNAAPTEPYANSTTEHRVQSGETFSMLAQQYGVTVKALKEANPKAAKRGLRADEVIVIPAVTISDDYVNEVVSAMPGKTDPAPQVTQTNEEQPAPTETVVSQDGMTPHRVQSGETLSILAQQYGVSIKAIKEANPKVAKRGLRADETIHIPAAGTVQTEAVVAEPTAQEPTAENTVANDEVIEHKVQKGETLFELSKKYNVSVDVIKSQNSRVLARGLQVGQVIKIKPQ